MSGSPVPRAWRSVERFFEAFDDRLDHDEHELQMLGECVVGVIPLRSASFMGCGKVVPPPGTKLELGEVTPPASHAAK